MNESTKCFIIEKGSYVEITYKELKILSEEKQSYRDKMFLHLHGMLMEVSEKDYRDFHKNVRRQKYLDEEATRNGMFSYHSFGKVGMSGEELVCDQSMDVEGEVMNKLLCDELHQCLVALGKEERRLLSALSLFN